MEHNGTVDRAEVDLNKLESNDINHDVVHPDFHSFWDEWVHTPDQDPAKILINEKTVYAVDQAMNVVLTDIKGNVLYGNKNIFDLTLFKPEELLGGHTRIFNAGFHTNEFFKDMWNTILSGEIWRGDLKNRRKDGKIIWVRLIITPLLDNSGKPFQFLALKEDITEKKEIEFRLAQKDKQLSALTNNSYDIIGIIDNLGEIIYLNPAFERVLGYPSYETIGCSIEDFLDAGMSHLVETCFSRLSIILMSQFDISSSLNIKMGLYDGAMRLSLIILMIRIFMELFLIFGIIQNKRKQRILLTV